MKTIDWLSFFNELSRGTVSYRHKKYLTDVYFLTKQKSITGILKNVVKMCRENIEICRKHDCVMKSSRWNTCRCITQKMYHILKRSRIIMYVFFFSNMWLTSQFELPTVKLEKRLHCFAEKQKGVKLYMHRLYVNVKRLHTSVIISTVLSIKKPDWLKMDCEAACGPIKLKIAHDLHFLWHIAYMKYFFKIFAFSHFQSYFFKKVSLYFFSFSSPPKCFQKIYLNIDQNMLDIIILCSDDNFNDLQKKS